jgi:hypothetical protein
VIEQFLKVLYVSAEAELKEVFGDVWLYKKHQGIKGDPNW